MEEVFLDTADEGILDHIWDTIGREGSQKQLTKHCGVCEEDDEYFGSPISHEIPLTFPKDHHANGVDIAAAVPEGLTPKPVLWKPEGQETPNLVRYIGGPQYLREEAAYLLDRSLGFYLVPVAWVSESNGEHGAAIWYTPGLQHGYSDLSKYDPEWVEKAGVFDYIISQADRGVSHNYGTHPDDDKRMILYDNGLSFPENESIYCHSVFCKAMLNKPLSVIPTLKRVLYDKAMWSDIQRLVGQQATDKAIVCLRRLIDEGMVTPYEHEHAGSISKVNPNVDEQPRDDKGRWSNSEGDTISAPQSVDKLHEYEGHLRTERKIERGALYDLSGKLVSEKAGDAHAIDWTPAELKSAQGGALTHNHLSGHGLSAADFRLAAISGVEVRATGTNREGESYTYSVKSSNPSFELGDKVHADFQSTWNRVQNEVYDDPLMAHESDTKVVHKIYDETAKALALKYGLIYSKVRHEGS